MKTQWLALSFCIACLSACSSTDDSSPAFSADSTTAEAGDAPATDGTGSESAPGGSTSAGEESGTGAMDESTSTAADSSAPMESAPAPDSDRGESTSPPIEPVSPEPIQPGTLTAGDYDDQLNPWLYQQYSDNYLQNVRAQTNIPRLDLSRRIGVIVVDNEGKPYAGANVDLLDAQGGTLSSLVTPANGITYLYEDLDNLEDEFTVKIEDRLGDVSMTRTIQLASATENRQIEFTLDTPSVAHSQLDLQLIIDTTGSMGDELSYLQTELSAILNNVQNDNPQLSIRAGLIVYRDNGDRYVVRSYPFTDNLDDMISALNGETHDGGGDYPEAMDQALAEALTFQWREQSVKVSLLVADAPPHLEHVNATWQSALTARSKQIHLVPLAASGVAEDAEYLMRSMAALTNSRYLFLTDDSGYGNTHNEPTVDCYIVTRLDGLIKRVVNQMVSGVRSEPSSNEVIREVGDYDKGVCQPEQ